MRRSNLFWLTVIVLVLSLSGGTAYAAHRYVVSSSKQVKNGALGAQDLSADAQASLRGRAGPTGATGAPGPAGPSAAYDLSILPTPLPAGQLVQVGSVQVPAGTYIAFARIQGRTSLIAAGTDTVDCDLSLNGTWLFDTATFHPGDQQNVERELTMQGGTETATGGTVQLKCTASGHSLAIVSAKITVVRVGSVTKLPLD
jgi:hypothetical protein